MSPGVPVISCATRGVPDVVEHGKTGMLCEAGDERAFAALVRELLLDVGKRSGMSRAAVLFDDPNSNDLENDERRPEIDLKTFRD